MSEEKTLPVGDLSRKLYGVNLLLTYRCTSECSHCFVSCSTRKDDPMKLSEVKEYLEEAKRLGASFVWLIGGEPFLYFDLLSGAIESAKQLGLETFTTSNAFWATSEESALRRLCLLKGKGLDSISFRADPFHWEYNPLEYVRNAIQAAKELNIEYSIGFLCYFRGKDDDSSLKFSREIATRMLGHRIYAAPILFQGTAAEVLAEHALKQPWTEYNECKCELCGSRIRLDQPDTVYIDPYGYVQPCCGISIGNAREGKLS